VLAGLDERGVPAVAVDLPGHGQSTLPLTDLHGDADHVASVLDAVDGPVVLVGHSYGGMVITDAGTRPNVEHLVYVAAYPPDAGETPIGLTLDHPVQPDIGAAIRIDEDGTSTIDPDLAGDLFYGDCKPDDVARAISLLDRQSGTTLAQPPRHVAWRERPATYVVCGDDHAVPPTLQRKLAERIPGVAVVEWPDSSHSPFLSRPGDVVDLLAGLASEEGDA
jgi:pimeloyl-ACP methyl ester carboxylesterase